VRQKKARVADPAVAATRYDSDLIGECSEAEHWKRVVDSARGWCSWTRIELGGVLTTSIIKSATTAFDKIKAIAD